VVNLRQNHIAYFLYTSDFINLTREDYGIFILVKSFYPEHRTIDTSGLKFDINLS